MALQYHIQCVGKKKIIKVDGKQQVHAAIIKEFALNQETQLSLQYYDAAWEDWVDVDNLDQLPEKGKLQATVVITMCDGEVTSALVNSATLNR